ncbi:MAG: hypothetical protein AABM42_07425 [Actinomycetota bacterium]
MGVYRVKWWFEDHWRHLVTAVAGLAVGAAAGVGVATGVPWESTESVVNPPSTSTVLRIRTKTATDAVTNGGTGTQTATAQGATAAVPASPGSVSYSGNGGKNLGTITVSSSSTLRWTNDGAIQINDDSGGIAVNSQAHSGTTAVEPGTYKNVHVHAIGKWTITIKPG